MAEVSASVRRPSQLAPRCENLHRTGPTGRLRAATLSDLGRHRTRFLERTSQSWGPAIRGNAQGWVRESSVSPKPSVEPVAYGETILGAGRDHRPDQAIPCLSPCQVGGAALLTITATLASWLSAAVVTSGTE